MMVFIQPTGSPLGQTIGFGPNGSSASLDTAPLETALAAGDLVLMQRQGALVKIAATAFPGGSAPAAGDVSAATVQVASTAPARSLATRASDYVNVLDYGADASGLQDSSAAFAAAIASVGTGMAVAIRVPRGSYLIDSTVATQGRTVAILLDDGADFAAGSTGYFGVTRVDGAHGAFSVQQINGGFFGMAPGTSQWTSIKTTNVTNNLALNASVFDERYENTNRWAATGGTQDQLHQRIGQWLSLFDGSGWLDWAVLNGPIYGEFEAATLGFTGSSQAGEDDVVANTPEGGWSDVDALGVPATGRSVTPSGGNAPNLGGHIRYAFGTAGGVTGGAPAGALNDRWWCYPALFSAINPAPTGYASTLMIGESDGAGNTQTVTISVQGTGTLSDWANAINNYGPGTIQAAVVTWGQSLSRLVIWSGVPNDLGAITLSAPAGAVRAHLGSGPSALAMLGYTAGTYFTPRGSQYITVFGAAGITGAAGATFLLNGTTITVGGAGKTADVAAAITNAAITGITAGVTVSGKLVVEAWAGVQQLAAPYWSGQVYPSLTIAGAGAAQVGLPTGTFFPPSPPAAFATAWSEVNPLAVPPGCVIAVNGTNVAVAGGSSAVAAAINAAGIANVQAFVRAGNRLGIRQTAGGTLALQDITGRALDLLGIVGGGVLATFQPGGYSAGSFNAFFAAPDSIAPGGRGFYAGGSSYPDASIWPAAPLEARGNFHHGLRLDRAAIGDAVALRMSERQFIAAGAPGNEVFLSLTGGLYVNGRNVVQAWLESLPTSPPAFAGEFWLNNGVLTQTSGTLTQLTDNNGNGLTDNFGNPIMVGAATGPGGVTASTTANVFSPLSYGGFWDGNSHPIGTAFPGGGITTFAALIAASLGGVSLSFLSGAAYGLSMSIPTYADAPAGSTTLLFQTYQLTPKRGFIGSGVAALQAGTSAAAVGLLIEGCDATNPAQATGKPVYEVSLSLPTTADIPAGTMITWQIPDGAATPVAPAASCTAGTIAGQIFTPGGTITGVFGRGSVLTTSGGVLPNTKILGPSYIAGSWVVSLSQTVGPATITADGGVNVGAIELDAVAYMATVYHGAQLGGTVQLPAGSIQTTVELVETSHSAGGSYLLEPVIAGVGINASTVKVMRDLGEGTFAIRPDTIDAASVVLYQHRDFGVAAVGAATNVFGSGATSGGIWAMEGIALGHGMRSAAYVSGGFRNCFSLNGDHVDLSGASTFGGRFSLGQSYSGSQGNLRATHVSFQNPACALFGVGWNSSLNFVEIDGSSALQLAPYHFYRSVIPHLAHFTATIATNGVMTVTAMAATSGPITIPTPNLVLRYPGWQSTGSTFTITAQTSGTAGGSGTYTISPAPPAAVAACQMIASRPEVVQTQPLPWGTIAIRDSSGEVDGCFAFGENAYAGGSYGGGWGLDGLSGLVIEDSLFGLGGSTYRDQDKPPGYRFVVSFLTDCEFDGFFEDGWTGDPNAVSGLFSISAGMGNNKFGHALTAFANGSAAQPTFTLWNVNSGLQNCLSNLFDDGGDLTGDVVLVPSGAVAAGDLVGLNGTAGGQFGPPPSASSPGYGFALHAAATSPGGLSVPVPVLTGGLFKLPVGAFPGPRIQSGQTIAIGGRMYVGAPTNEVAASGTQIVGQAWATSSSNVTAGLIRMAP